MLGDVLKKCMVAWEPPNESLLESTFSKDIYNICILYCIILYLLYMLYYIIIFYYICVFSLCLITISGRWKEHRMIKCVKNLVHKYFSQIFLPSDYTKVFAIWKSPNYSLFALCFHPPPLLHSMLASYLKNPSMRGIYS